MQVKGREVYKIDLILIIGSLLILIVLIGYSRPLIISPVDKFETSNSSVLFTFDKADVILIDNNPNFTSPEKINVQNNLVISLKPGIYYWKVESNGILESEVRQLTINSEVSLKLREANEKYEVINSGNTRLNIDLYDKGIYTGNVILEVDKSANVSGTKFVGSQDE